MSSTSAVLAAVDAARRIQRIQQSVVDFRSTVGRSDRLQDVIPVDDETVRKIVDTLRSTFAWEHDGFCTPRAMYGAAMADAMAGNVSPTTWRSGIALAYGPFASFPAHGYTFHMATMLPARAGPHIYDRLVADLPVPVPVWERLIGAPRGQTTLHTPTAMLGPKEIHRARSEDLSACLTHTIARRALAATGLSLSGTAPSKDVWNAVALLRATEPAGSTALLQTPDVSSVLATARAAGFEFGTRAAA